MNQKKIGEFIAELRKEKGLTQAELAEKLNVIATKYGYSERTIRKMLQEKNTKE